MGFLAGLLSTAGDRRTIESPSVPLSSSNVLSYLGVGPTEAGVEVTEAAALRVAAVFACLRVRAEALAALPWGVFERSASGGSVEVLTHPLSALLRDMNKREALSWHVDGWGNGYLEVKRAPNGGPVRELFLHDPKTSRAEIHESGELHYMTDDNGTPRAVAARNMIHVAGPGFDGLSGYPLLTMHKDSIGYALAARQSGAKLMANDGRPRGVIEIPHRLQPDAGEGIRAEFESQQVGANFGRVGVLGGGAKYQNIGLPPDQLQYIEQMSLGLLDIARVFMVPPHKVGFLRDAGDRANIEHENLRFATDVLTPAARRLELATDLKALSIYEQGRGMFTKIDLRGMLRGDFQSRMEGYRTGKEIGLYNTDEMRAWEDLPPIQGRIGTTYYVPANWVDAAKEPTTQTTPDSGAGEQTNDSGGDADADLVEQFRPLALDAAERFLRREAEELVGISRRIERYGVDAVSDRIESLWASQARRFEAAFRPVVEAALGETTEDHWETRRALYARRHAAVVFELVEKFRPDREAIADALRDAVLERWPQLAADLADAELAAVKGNE